MLNQTLVTHWLLLGTRKGGIRLLYPCGYMRDVTSARETPANSEVAFSPRAAMIVGGRPSCPTEGFLP